MTMFLELQVNQNSTGILLHQAKYVDDILEKFGFTDAKPASTPIAEGPLLTPDTDGETVDQTHYKSMIGSLMYLTTSRPDIINYGGCELNRKSTSGGCQFLGDRLVLWQCKKQHTISTSTAEVEYVAASA
ncbi:uncharacterized mitochondrial protein AtMg00810-like [Lactuca sativa]|uniref:uncharacterized mitochondrial protein AtMg00810-like n=1 Tax=Lactuca sativa TaxID=4236 RepID=UPI0022B01301|nr:uncharacterized mitochondrial protein AtMg00810-like [Lactuca sativa]